MTASRPQNRASHSFPCERKCWGGVGKTVPPTTPTPGKLHGQHSRVSLYDCFCHYLFFPLFFVLSASCLCLRALSWRLLFLASLCVDPVSRKNVKSAHSTRNRYSSQWTLTKCQASTPARTLTSDWRTVGSQHGVTVTESDSYSASLSQDTGVPRDLPASHPSPSRSPQPLPTFLFPVPV